MPAGWGLDFLQLHKGVAFYDPDEPGDRAGVIANLHDLLAGDPDGFVSASISVLRWTVVREHGAAKKVVKEEAATAAALKDFGKTYPELKGKAETEAVLCWAVKPGQPDRRIPLWHVTASAPSGGLKPEIHTYRVDAWTGAILSSKGVAIPGRVPNVPPPPPPRK